MNVTVHEALVALRQSREELAVALKTKSWAMVRKAKMTQEKVIRALAGNGRS